MKRVDLKKILYMDFLSGTSAQAHPRNLQQDGYVTFHSL